MGLLTGHGVAAYVSYLAALRLGAAVIPLNPKYPAERNRMIYALSEADVLLADESGAAQVGEVTGAEIVVRCADDEIAGYRTESAALPPYRASLDDIAYVLFTSGSTGRPKGVPIQHRNVSPYISHNIGRYEVSPGCRLSQTFDLTFDPSVHDLFVAWGAGATLVAPSAQSLLTPVDYLNDAGITHWFSVPSVVSVAAELGNLLPGRASTIRHSLFIGEQLTVEQAAAWYAATGGGRITNVYGPTELTIACTEYTLPEDPSRWPSSSNRTVPIGDVYRFLDFLVLDESGQPAEEGELCVRGAQRFSGYLAPSDNAGRFLSYDGTHGIVFDGSDELTAQHYYRTGDNVRYESGTLVHRGRSDNQVKVRGYRIELGEIEAVLRQHPQINQAVVVALRDGADLRLCGCYTGTPLARGDLLRWLRKRLPVPMIPRPMQHVDTLPLNANGKVDRGQVRDLVSRRQPERSLTPG